MFLSHKNLGTPFAHGILVKPETLRDTLRRYVNGGVEHHRIRIPRIPVLFLISDVVFYGVQQSTTSRI